MASSNARDPNVVFKRLGDRIVLVSLATNQVFELNSTGARIWEMLDEGACEDEIVERLSAEFDAPPEQLEKDLGDLLRELRAQGLIT